MIRQILDAEANRLIAAEPDLRTRVAAALASERRRSRERRYRLASAAAAALMVAWLGAAPLGGVLRLNGDLAVPTARAAETPQAERAPTPTPALASGGLSGTATATTTSTPAPSP
jgi:hypothetical protein